MHPQLQSDGPRGTSGAADGASSDPDRGGLGRQRPLGRNRANSPADPTVLAYGAQCAGCSDFLDAMLQAESDFRTERKPNAASKRRSSHYVPPSRTSTSRPIARSHKKASTSPISPPSRYSECGAGDRRATTRAITANASNARVADLRICAIWYKVSSVDSFSLGITHPVRVDSAAPVRCGPRSPAGYSEH